MEKKDLIITVSGQYNSGKSRMILLLKNFLRENGFEVEFKGNYDHPTEATFDANASKHFDEVIDQIKESYKIKLQEIQLAKNFYANDSAIANSIC